MKKQPSHYYPSACKVFKVFTESGKMQFRAHPDHQHELTVISKYTYSYKYDVFYGIYRNVHSILMHMHT